jgi:hypothetical protein
MMIPLALLIIAAPVIIGLWYYRAEWREFAGL